MRLYLRFQPHTLATNSVLPDILLLLVVTLLLLGICLQMAILARLFVLLGELDNFAHTLYFSGVTFATLSYGDGRHPKAGACSAP
jgi:hypothetical protein